MRRIFAICLFATAAAAATAAGAGVAVAPHVDPPGTPLFHTHAPSAYRLPLFFNVPRFPPEPRAMSMSAETLFDLAATLVLGLLALAIPRLPRPTLTAVAKLAPIRVARARGHTAAIHGPPRAALRA